MAINERINYFRNKRGTTQKRLGQAVGFPQKAAEVRVLRMQFCCQIVATASQNQHLLQNPSERKYNANDFTGNS